MAPWEYVTVLKQCWSSMIGVGFRHAVSELQLDSMILAGLFQLAAAQEECSCKKVQEEASASPKSSKRSPRLHAWTSSCGASWLVGPPQAPCAVPDAGAGRQRRKQEGVGCPAPAAFPAGRFRGIPLLCMARLALALLTLVRGWKAEQCPRASPRLSEPCCTKLSIGLIPPERVNANPALFQPREQGGGVCAGPAAAREDLLHPWFPAE